MDWRRLPGMDAIFLRTLMNLYNWRIETQTVSPEVAIRDLLEQIADELDRPM